MKKTISLLVILLLIASTNVTHAYSDKIDACIDRVVGHMMKFATDASSIKEIPPETISNFCLKYPPSIDYDNFTELGKTSRDTVEYFEGGVIISSYVFDGLLQKISYDSNIFRPRMTNDIGDLITIQVKHVSDNRDNLLTTILNPLVAQGYTFAKYNIDTINEIYNKFITNKDLVVDALSKNYICKSGLYSSYNKTVDCHCYDGFTWNNANNACAVPSTKPVVVISPIETAQLPIKTLIATPKNPFDDLSESDPNMTAIIFLKNKSIISGYPDGTYRSANTLNRAELLKIVVLAKYPQPISTFDQSCFKDTQKGTWYTPYICFAKGLNIVQGYSNNTFKPEQEITYTEALKITLGALGYSSTQKTQPWYQSYLDKATMMKVGLVGLEPNHLLTRGEMAQLIMNIMNYTPLN